MAAPKGIRRKAMNDLVIFKHWFSGFRDAVGKCPDETQWETLQEYIRCMTERMVILPPDALGSGDSYMDDNGGFVRTRLVPRHTDGDGV